MPDCRYCADSFPDESAYLDHLEAAHVDELSPIDRRRVEGTANSSPSLSRGAVLVGGMAIVVVAVVVYVTFFSGGSSASGEPTDLWSVHFHGTMTVQIEDQTLDFSQSRYQLQADAFHYEGGDGSQWHVHARDVTLSWGLSTLGIDVTASSVSVDGTTYRDGDADTTVRIEVNGSSVDPTTYVLRDGDHVSIVVERT